jgi:hypothetical protein
LRLTLFNFLFFFSYQVFVLFPQAPLFFLIMFGVCVVPMLVGRGIVPASHICKSWRRAPWPHKPQSIPANP